MLFFKHAPLALRVVEKGWKAVRRYRSFSILGDGVFDEDIPHLAHTFISIQLPWTRSSLISRLMTGQPPIPRSLRILCFGASITAGYTSLGQAFHPYAYALERTLRPLLPFTTSLKIDVDGQPGDVLIGGNYWPRMERRLGRVHTETKLVERAGSGEKARGPSGPLENEPYDFVVLQAGGNDLAKYRTPEDIFQAAKEMWDYILTSAAYNDVGGTVDASPQPRTKVIALTVTETTSPSPSKRAAYARFNSMILAHAADEEQQNRGFYVADICAVLPFHKLSEKHRAQLWDDDVHFKSAGYDVFGMFIAGRLAQIMGLRGKDLEEHEKKLESAASWMRAKL